MVVLMTFMPSRRGRIHINAPAPVTRRDHRRGFDPRARSADAGGVRKKQGWGVMTLKGFAKT